MKIFRVVLAGWILILAQGCAAPTGVGQDPVSQHYVMLKPAETDLVSVTNDDQAMFFKFAYAIGPQMQFFDGEGKPLKNIRHNDTVCVMGHHREVLIKNGKNVSFVAVREGAKLSEGPRVSKTATILLLQQRTIERMAARDKMRKAMARAAGRLTEQAVSPQAAFEKAAAATVPQVTVKTLSQPEAIDWTARTPEGLPASDVDLDEARGYLTFVDDTLQPVKAVKVIDAMKSLADKKSGVLLISGITGSRAGQSHIDLAMQRAEFVKAIFMSEGVAESKLTVTAVYRTNVYTNANSRRPRDTVTLTWLNAEATLE